MSRDQSFKGFGLPIPAQSHNQIPSCGELALFAPFVVGATRRNGMLRMLDMGLSMQSNQSLLPAGRPDLRLAADIGGTFTDVAAFDAATGKLRLGKALSTPNHLVEGITAGVESAGIAYADAGLFLHGSTVAIN